MLVGWVFWFFIIFFICLSEALVAQPPLPLQEFFPLQPLSLVLQPPWPLQEFLPWQECFACAFCGLVLACPYPADIAVPEWPAGAAFTRLMVPPSSPVRAAVSTIDCLEAFIV